MQAKHKLKEIESLPVKSIVVKSFGRTFEVYPWLKPRLFHKLVIGKETLQDKNYSTALQQLRTLRFDVFNLFRRYDAWAFSSSIERVLLEDKYTDKLFDYIGSYTGVKLLMIELELFSKIKQRKKSSNYAMSKAWLIFCEEVYARLFLRRVKVENAELLRTIEGKLELSIRHEEVIKKYLAQYRVMAMLLRILPKPKIVFLSVSYTNFGYVRAFKEAGIKVVEFQHGLIGDEHYAYRYYYEPDAIQFPDEVLVFGKKDKAYFEALTRIPIKAVTVIGRYLTDYYMRKADLNALPVKQIVVSLQDSEWSLALLRFVLECNERTSGQIRWVIQTRRTPKEFYTAKFKLPANIVFSEVSVYEAIATSDAHLTIYSTTAIESLAIGKPTFLFNYQNAANTYLGYFLKDKANVYFCNDSKDFTDAWSSMKLVSIDEVAASNEDNICSGFERNMNEYISKCHELRER
jgi:hypothetical protein